MAKQALTEERIDALRPRRQRYEVKDPGCRGLEVRITPSGTRTFCAVYKTQGRQRRETLGRFPQLSLTDARKRVADILERRQAAPDTIAGLSNRYLDQHPNPSDAERVFRLHINPRVGQQFAARLRRADVLELLDAVKGNGKTVARDVHKHLRAMYYWAMDYELVGNNPAARISKIKRPELRDADDDGRPYTDEELKAVWHAAVQMGYPFGTLYQLLMLTGQRRGDWSDARWSETVDRSLVVPAERYKTRRQHTVPLSTPVRGLLQRLPRFGDSDFLFPSQGGKGDTISGFSRAAAICRRLSGVHVRPKDFRTTMRTRMSQLSVRLDVAEMILGHVQDRMVRIYDQHNFEQEKRAALEKYARHLKRVVR